jgi:hypothetical protein
MTSITDISTTDFSSYNGGNYQAMEGIASSSDGTIIYVSILGVPDIGVMKSTNSGATWNNVYPNYAGFRSIACSSNGNIVYAANLGDGLYKSTDAGSNWSRITFSPNDNLPGGTANPEVSDSSFGGYQLTNIFIVACDSTGDNLIMTTNAAASIYRSTDGGSSWSFVYAIPGYSTTPTGPTYVTSNADGTILYASLNNTTAKTIIVSRNSGVTWTTMNTFGQEGPFRTLSSNSYGDFVFAVYAPGTGPSYLNVFYPTHSDNAILTPANGNTFVSLANYNDGDNVVITQSNKVTSYSIVNKYSPGEAPIPCFKDGTKILTINGYKLIEELRKGDLVKTVEHGYKPIDIIGKIKITHLATPERIPEKLYKFCQSEFSEMFEDLIITGGHSSLVSEFKNNQREQTQKLCGKIYITDNRYLLPACIDERTKVYENPGTYTVYHFALENDNYNMNYGVYANGLLVESCSKRYLKDTSNMEIID